MGASSVGTQLKCSLWRHALGHLRQWPWVAGALVVALTPFALLAGLKSTAPPQHEEACHFEARGLSTEWPLGQLQSFVCGLANECQEEGQDDLLDSYPGAAVNDLVNATQLIDGSSTTLLDRLFALPWSLNTLKAVTDLITAPALTNLMENGLRVSDLIRSPSELSQKLTSGHDLDPTVVEAFLDARINVSRVFALAGRRGPREVVCSPQYLEEFLVTNDTTAITDISWNLCHLPLAQAANVTSVFLSSLDTAKVLHKVGEVMEAVGGYNRDLLVQQIGGLLAAVSRLEALVPLGKHLQPVLGALSPAISARKILSLSMWNETSLADLMGFVEDVVRSFSSDPKTAVGDVAKGATDAVLHLLSVVTNPANFTSTLEGLSDPWEAVLKDVGVSMKAVMAEVEAVPDYLRSHPIERSLLALGTSSLSSLLHEQTYDEVSPRIHKDLDEVLRYLLEAVDGPVNGTVSPFLVPALRSAAAFVNASNVLSSLMVMEPSLPTHLSLRLLALLSNCSQLVNATDDDEGLSGWLCDRSSWGQVSDGDWDALSTRLCSSGGVLQLQNATQMLQKTHNYSQMPQDAVEPSEVVKAARELASTLQYSTHLHAALQSFLSGGQPTPDFEWFWRWLEEGKREVMEGKEEMPVVPVVPPFGDKELQDLREGAPASKFFLRRLMSLYFKLVDGGCWEGNDTFLTQLRVRPGALDQAGVTDMAASVLDTVVRMVVVAQQPRQPGDPLAPPTMTSFLSNILLPNMLEVVTRATGVMRFSSVVAPAPVPQVIELLHATHSALASIAEEDNVWAWCGNGSCPHLANLTSRAYLLPDLLALSYIQYVTGATQPELQEALAYPEAIRFYPCQNNLTVNTDNGTITITPFSITMYFPPMSVLAPAARPTVERVKQDIKDLEEYICVNFDEIVDELTSNEALTTAVKAFMDDLRPGRVNILPTFFLGAAFRDTLISLDPYEIMTNLTGGSLALEDFEKPFSYSLLDGSTSDRVVQRLENTLEALSGRGEARFAHPQYPFINLALHAAHNISTALVNTLRDGNVSLAAFLGLSADDPDFSRVMQGPEGLADYVLHHLNASLITAVMDNDWEGLVFSLCNDTSSMIPWVEVVCKYTFHAMPHNLLPSEVAAAVLDAVRQFQQPYPPDLPPMTASQLFSDFQELNVTLLNFDYKNTPSLAFIDRLVNVTKEEVDKFVDGLRRTHEDWPMLMVDALVKKGPVELQMVLRQAHFILRAVLLRLPTTTPFTTNSNTSSANSTIITLTDIHNLVNTTWVDLLAGIHYNIHQHHQDLESLSKQNVCGPDSTLQEPEGGDGSFLDAVGRLCQLVATGSDVKMDYWQAMNTSTLLPPTKEIYVMARELVGRLQSFWVAGRQEGLEGVIGWPSYFVKENWQDLLVRIYPNATQSEMDNFEELVPSVLVALGWLGVPQNSTVPNQMTIQMKWMQLLLAKDLKEALNSTPELSEMADILTQTAPLAVKDLVEALRDQPATVGEMLAQVQGLYNVDEMCQVNISVLGSHLMALQERLCPPRGPQALIADLKSLLGIDLLEQPVTNTSLEDTVRSTLAYISTMDQMEEVARRLSSPRDLVQYFGVQHWLDLPSDAFNVTREEMEKNSTMIFAALLDPLMEASGPKNASYYALLHIDAVLRQTHWLLALSFGDLEGAYMDKPMVIQLLHLIDNLPEIIKEYFNIFASHSSLLEAIRSMSSDPCTFHITLLEKAAEMEMPYEGSGPAGWNDGRLLLNNTFHYFCDRGTQRYLMTQLIPGNSPLIMGQHMDLDAATLAHLMTETWKAAAAVLEGEHARLNFTPPPWLSRYRWEDVYYQLRRFSYRWTPQQVLLDGLFLGLSSVEKNINAPGMSYVNVAYELATRLADNINETTGRLDLVAAAEGLGIIEDTITRVVPRLPMYIAMAMWFPETMVLWRFMLGEHWLDLYREMCTEGPQHLFVYPNLPQDDWDAMQYVLCNTSLQYSESELIKALGPLMNKSEFADGELVDWVKVREAMGRLMNKLLSLDPHQFSEPFVNNPYMAMQRQHTPAQRVVQALMGPLTMLYRGLLEDGSAYSQHRMASYLAQATVFLQPIVKEGAPSLLERLVDHREFWALLMEYKDIYSLMQDAAEDLEMNSTVHNQVVYEAQMTLVNLTEALVPHSGLGMSPGESLVAIINTVLSSGDSIIHTVSGAVCPNNASVLGEEWTRLGQVLAVASKQIWRDEEHVDLLCQAPATNLTHVLRSLWDDLGWKEEVQLLAAGLEGTDPMLCTDLMKRMEITYGRFYQVLNTYAQDKTVRTRLFGCLDAAFHSITGQQLIGVLVATGDILKSLTDNENFTRQFSTFLDTLPDMSRTLEMLGSRVAVMVPLEEVLLRDYGTNLNLTAMALNATKYLLVDVNRIYPGDVEKLAALSKTLEGMQKWLQEVEGAGTDFEGKTPLEVLYEVAQERGEEVFAEDLLENVNFAHLLTEVDNMRIKAVLSLAWLESLISHFRLAMDSLTSLSHSGSIVDLNKLITGEQDPVAFLSNSVEFIHMEQWTDLAKSFQGLLEEGVPLLTGSQLSEDLQVVVDGVGSLMEARDMGLLDLSVPITSLVANWSALEDYLVNELHMEAKVVEALATSELNLLELLSLEGTTVDEVFCEGHQVGRLVVLPADAQVTPDQLSAALCHTNDTQALASSFINHLNLAPLMSMLTRFGVNASLSSHGVSLGEVTKAVRNVIETSEHLPKIMTTLRTFQNLSKTLLRQPRADSLVANHTAATIGDITSPEFLERAGQALCGRPLVLMPDTLRLQEAKNKNTKSSVKKPEEMDVCERLHEDLRSMPGGGLLLHYVKPLLSGKIFYTPDNSITRAIIAEANRTFETVDTQRQYLSHLSRAAKDMTSIPSTDIDLQKLRKALDLPWVQGAMEELLHPVPSPASISSSSSSLSEDLTSMPSLTSLMANLQMSSHQLLESSQLVREFSDVLEVGVSLMDCLQLQRFVPVNNESQLLEEAHDAVQNKEFLAGVVFKGVGESGSTQTVLPLNMTYAIRVDHSKSPPTFLLGPRFWRPGPYSDMAFYMRYQQGFIQLQETLEHSILKLQHQQTKAEQRSAAQQRRRRRAAEDPIPLSAEEEDLLLNLPVHTKQEPYPCYTKDDFLQMVNESPVMSFIFSFLSLVLFSTFLIQQLVQERESRNKQLQEVMGLRLWLDDLVWLLCSLLLLLLIVVLAALLLSLGGLQPRSDFGVLMAFLLCYGISVVSFCYMVACLVPTTVLAVFVGVMGLLVFNVPFITISVIQTMVPFTAIALTCLLPSTAFGFGFRVICQYELVEEGANYGNMWTPPTQGSDMTLGLAMVMLLVDTLLFLLITLAYNYFRNARLPACRPPILAGLPHNSKVVPLKEEEDTVIRTDSVKKDALHVVDLDLGLKQSLRKGLSITGLRKIYHHGGSGSRVAVDGVTLDLYEGQVTALLGHNGAGKTTIISMLTHEVKPTAGKITVYGEDVGTSEGWEKARQMMGLCPQESVLFPLLTVEETLAYYIALKQHPGDPPPASVDSVLANMDLLEHRTFLSHQLSEGLRRRLCMALAFVGNSKLVVLDEPTSGIDPLARSAMWEVISNNRSGRTILLTTHHLDEAETLADRVAVLNKGRLLCVGSPLALKSEYGLGYSITLSHAPPPLPTPPTKTKTKADSLHVFTEKTALSYSELPFKVLKTSSDGFALTGDDVKGGGKEKVWEVVKQYVPNARLLENINGEVTYSLPIHDALGNPNRIPEVFGELESSLDSLGFSSLELRPTSLEDVIITLNTINAIDNAPNTTSLKVELPSEPQKEDLASKYDFSLEYAECCVWLRRLAALLHKRLLHHGRDWHFYVQMFVLPFLFIFLAMVSSKWRPSYSSATPLTFTPDLYPEPSTTFLRTLDPILGPLAEEVTELSLGAESRTGNWSTCPDFVADIDTGLEQCSMVGTGDRSPCQCVDERCVVEASNQQSLNNWILATRNQHVQSRPAGISLGVRDPREGDAGKPAAVVWYDNSAFHALPSHINLLNNARLRRLTTDNHSITAINHPIIFSLHGMWSMNIQQYVADLGIGLLVLVAMTVVCASTVGCVVAERVRGERRLLHLAGLSKTTYWIASALWDTGVLVLDILLIALIFLAFKEQQFIWRENLSAFILLALLYGLSLLPLFYLSEGWFRTEASAVFSFFCTSFGVGLITTLLLVVCQVMSYIQGLHDTAAVIKYVFLIFPPFAFTCSLKDMAAGYTKSSIMARFDMDLYQSPFTWDAELEGGLGVYMVALAAWAVVGWALLLLPRPTPAPAPLPLISGGEEDKDVAAERIKIQSGGSSLYDTVLRLVGLGHDFSSPRVSAVGSLFLALRRGECFSLLGLNGAGKTTTFRCLTGDLQPSRGQILVNGLLLEEALELPHPMLSYCPQSHALDPNLTPKEVLTSMARVRGATGLRTAKVVEQAIKQLGLSAEVNTYVRHLSGGNKRKLSVAVSLLGNPLLVLMDEPTTGMDPASRRLVWQAIQSVPQNGRSVLLTSHSMDEVNQLSHRLAIMVNGQFVCLGSPHYLKYRLGDKYTVRLKTKDIEDMTYVVDYLRSQLKEVLLKEQHHLSLVVEVSRQLPLRLIFDTLNGAKALGVTEYDVSQTTLNEVFRVLTSHQGDGQTLTRTKRPSQDHDSLPSPFPHLSSVGGKGHPQNTFQHPSIFSPMECTNPKEPYVDFGGVPLRRNKESSPASESGSANDSPEEEWTPF